MLHKDFQDLFQKPKRLLEEMQEDLALFEAFAQAVGLCRAALQQGHKLLLAGNGGSAAEAQHWAAELVVRFRQENRPALPAIALSTDTSILTAIGNDFGFPSLFARQVEALGQPGDVLLVLTTSGRSSNILKACQVAQAKKLLILGFTGQGTPEAFLALCTVCLKIPSVETEHIQEGHMILGHALCRFLEETAQRLPS
ncbi:MAG: SIS domain-containing protein [Holosporales bacterium]|jgi:D-sedoheptulose 7-phosphate isomerase|nr:SIS domain-containing protein [Holosporales bacterium]